MRQFPLVEAMARAVGGDYDKMGAIELDVLLRAGFRDNMSLLDLGCGSGRLAAALASSGLTIDYTGVDVVQQLLDYAQQTAPPHFRFLLNTTLVIPAATQTLDFAVAFSLFTHLHHHETYAYLADMHRALKPSGRLVFSFLEFAAESHWAVFMDTIRDAHHNVSPHLNCFIERSVIALWAEKLGYAVRSYIEPTALVGATDPLGQSAVVLERL